MFEALILSSHLKNYAKLCIYFTQHLVNLFVCNNTASQKVKVHDVNKDNYEIWQGCRKNGYKPRLTIQYLSMSNMSYDEIKAENMTSGQNPLRVKRMICVSEVHFALEEINLV